MPNIDLVANEEVLFVNNYSRRLDIVMLRIILHWRVCFGHGADVHHEFLHIDFPMMVEILGKLGYGTVGLS